MEAKENRLVIPLLLSDIEFGCHEFGFIPRAQHGDDSDISDAKSYLRHLHKQGVRRARVVHDHLLIE